jgi:hypothetical protein
VNDDDEWPLLLPELLPLLWPLVNIVIGSSSDVDVEEMVVLVLMPNAAGGEVDDDNTVAGATPVGVVVVVGVGVGVVGATGALANV